MAALTVLWLAFIIRFQQSYSQADVPVVCGGFVKSSFYADFTLVKVNLYSIDGTLKYSTDCAPNNGYFLLPLYDQGEYLVKTTPPQGWMITPNEVPLVVKDSKNSCNSGKDIFFQLIGFALEGQITSGDSLPGPEGVEISLLAVTKENSGEATAQHVYTATEGRFKMEGISPGAYQLLASHPLWKVSPDPVEVTVVDAPLTTPPGLKVLGYDVKGSVRSGGEPVQGVLLFLFGKGEDQIVCSLSVSSPPASPRASQTPLCIVSSDSAGNFILYPLPPGTYSVVPVYRQKDLHFEIHPVEVHFTVSNDSVILPQHFEVQGFSVAGQVLLTREGPPVMGAQVLLSDKHETTTDEHGQYQLLNVTTGTYTLKVNAEGMHFDPREVYISPTSPSLLPVSPNKYLVCGDITETIPVSMSKKLSARGVQVFSGGSNPRIIASTTTQEQGSFCVYLPLGEYRIKVVVSPEETEKGMLILPEEQFVAMLDTPVTSKILFTQFLANISGSVTCLENCPASFDVRLVRSGEGRQELFAQVQTIGKEAHFSFSNVLPGAVKVTLDYARWCWKLTEFATVVVKGNQSPIHFNHTGYSMKYEVTHDTLIKYYEGNSTAKEVVLIGKGSLCFEKSGIYHVLPQSCHQFEKSSYTFDTSSPQVLVLQSIGHFLHIPVHTEMEDSSLFLIIRTHTGEEVVQPETSELRATGKWVYSFSVLVRTSEELIIQPQSSVLMFSPPSLVWTAGQDCPESVPAFLGSPGELIEGHVEPPLPNVTVVLDLGGDGQVTTYTDKSGHYRAGPVRGGDHITISLAMDGYIFEPENDLRSFRAVKLCDVTIQVLGVNGAPLLGALVSISGDNFRQNRFTDENGFLFYSKLVPGQYFIKLFLREFEFAPSSLILDLTEIKNKAVLFTGRRVAFSCSGVVSTLNRRPFSEVEVQASGREDGENCSYSETASTDSEGSYRLHGLMPGCQYNVSVRQNIGDISHPLPAFRTLLVEESDIESVDFLLMPQDKSVYISGWVNTDLKFVGTLKASVFIEGNAGESPLYSVTVDNVGFFDLPPLPPLSKENYFVVLETTLPAQSYKYSIVEEVVSGIYDSHILLRFEAEEIYFDKDSQSRGSVVALAVVIVIAFAVVNFEKVLVWIRNYAYSIPSTSDGTDNRQKRTATRNNYKK